MAISLLLTRQSEDSVRFLELLPDLGLRAVISPLIETCVRPGVVRMQGVGGVIFTSAAGVRAAADLNVMPDLPCYCVGARTAQVARDAGWQAVQAGQNADTLVAGLLAQRPDGPLLHLRGAHARGDVAARLTAQGMRTREQVIYDQLLQPLTPDAQAVLADEKPVIVTLFSPRAARQFAETAPVRTGLYLCVMSDAVAEQVKHLKTEQVFVAARPDSAAMADCVGQAVRQASRVEGAGRAQ